MNTLALMKKISFPRYTGTVGEIKARRLIHKEFKKIGFNVKEEVVKYIKSDKYYKFVNLTLIWLFWILVVISGFLCPLVTIISFLAYYIIKTKIFPKIELNLAKDKSANIITSKDKDKEYKLIICGHYDSSKIMRKSIQKNLRIFMNFFPIISLAFYSFFLLLFLRGILFLFGLEIFWINIIWKILWWSLTIGFGMFNLLFSYFLLTTPNKYSNGADDNASGIAVMIKVAKALKTLNLKMGVDFIFFTDEERGAWGSRNWIHGHAKHIDKDKTYFLNIDCVGRGKTFFLTKGLGKIFKKKSDPMLCELVENTCNELGYRLKTCWDTISDDIKLLENNLRVCSIMRCNTRKAGIIDKIIRKCFFIPTEDDLPFMNWVHTRNDTVKYIDENKLEETSRMVINVFKRLDERLYSIEKNGIKFH